MRKDLWADGFCKKCGHLVIETPSNEADYMNTCTNPECSEFGWHHVGDDEELDYYEHKE